MIRKKDRQKLRIRKKHLRYINDSTPRVEQNTYKLRIADLWVKCWDMVGLSSQGIVAFVTTGPPFGNPHHSCAMRKTFGLVNWPKA